MAKHTPPIRVPRKLTNDPELRDFFWTLTRALYFIWDRLGAGVSLLPIIAGGTGAGTAALARTNLGLEIGTDVQAWDAQLDDIAGLAVTDGNVIVGDGINWVAESGATARTSLGVTIGTDVQAWDAQLDDIAALPFTNGNVIVGTGTAWAAESGATARSSLGLGASDNPTFNNVTVNNAEINGTLNHDGTTVGFYNTAPVAQAGALTAQSTTITHTAPGTPDFALQDLVDSGVGSAFGFATKDEGNTLLSVVANLQARVAELEAALDSSTGVGIVS